MVVSVSTKWATYYVGLITKTKQQQQKTTTKTTKQQQQQQQQQNQIHKWIRIYKIYKEHEKHILRSITHSLTETIAADLHLQTWLKLQLQADKTITHDFSVLIS